MVNPAWLLIVFCSTSLLHHLPLRAQEQTHSEDSSFANDDVSIAHSIQLASFYPTPLPEQIAAWTKQVFATDTILVFASDAALVELIESANLDPAVARELIALAAPILDDDQWARAVPFFTVPGPNRVYVNVTNDLYAKLNTSFLTKAFAHRAQYFGLGPPSLSFSSLSDLRAYLDRYPESVRAELKKSVFRVDANISLAVNPYTWQFLDDVGRDLFVQSWVSDKPATHESLNVDLHIEDPSQIPAFAQYFAQEGNSPAIGRYLNGLWRGKAPGPLLVPLTKILAPVMRKKIHTFETLSGPNCANAAISANRGNRYDIEHLAEEPLMKEIYCRFRLVGPAEKLRPYDVLLYYDEDDQLIHIAAYAAPAFAPGAHKRLRDDLVFTKNGASKFRPYIIQHRRVNEQAYFGDSNYRLYVARRVAGSERPIDPRGEGHGPEVHKMGKFRHPKLVSCESRLQN